MTFAEKIRRLCAAKGWNQSELARRVEVSKSTVSNWFEGQRKPFDDSLIKLSDIFECRIDDLCRDAQDTHPTSSANNEEESLLILFRALGLGVEEAMRRLAGAAPPATASAFPPSPPKRGTVDTLVQQRSKDSKG